MNYFLSIRSEDSSGSLSQRSKKSSMSSMMYSLDEDRDKTFLSDVDSDDSEFTITEVEGQRS